MRFDRPLEEGFDARLEVFDFFALESLQLSAHQAAHVLEQHSTGVDLALLLLHLDLDLLHPLHLTPAGTLELVLIALQTRQLLLRRMPGMKRPLPLPKSLLHAADQTQVLVDDNAEGEHVLHRLALVEFLDAELEVAEGVEGPGERGAEFDAGERVERGGEVAAGVGEGLSLRDNGVGGLLQRAELGVEGVEVDAPVVEPVVVFDELASGAAAPAQADGAENAAFALAREEGIFAAVLVLDVDVEGLAFQERLQVAIMLQHGVGGGLVDHALERHAPALDEIGVEAVERLFLGRRRDRDARMVVVQTLVQPEEVAVAPGHGEGGGVVGFGGRARDDGVDGVRAGGAAHGVRVADGDAERRFRGLFDGD